MQEIPELFGMGREKSLSHVEHGMKVDSETWLAAKAEFASNAL